MQNDPRITFSRGETVLLKDLGIDVENVFRRAGLAFDLTKDQHRVPVDVYFQLIEAAEAEAQDPLLPIKMAHVASPEIFSPPIFASLCSSNLAVAAERMSAHKRLIAPMHLHTAFEDRGFSVSWSWDDPSIRPPRLLMAMELAFMVQIARIGTREHIRAVEVSCPLPLFPEADFADFFGVTPIVSPIQRVVFSSEDAKRPFLTASDVMWAAFEPELQRQLNAFDTNVSLAARIRSVLFECLPSGEATIDGVARRMGMSRRTLQRRLSDEDLTFRALVQAVRERLARHYLVETSISHQEIAFLLGFDEASSYFRAFREWTGVTPESVRASR